MCHRASFRSPWTEPGHVASSLPRMPSRASEPHGIRRPGEQLRRCQSAWAPCKGGSRMKLSRRSFAAGALIGATALRPAQAAGWAEHFLADTEGLENIVPAVETYVYGYSLITMEMTRRVMTNVAAAEGSHAPMGQFVRMREYPTAASVTSPRRMPIPSTRPRGSSRQGTLGAEPARHEGALLPVSDAGRLDQRVPGAGNPHHRYRRPDLRHHRSGLERHFAAGREGVQVANRLVWILGRIYCTGTPEDYAAVHAFRMRARWCR